MDVHVILVDLDGVIADQRQGFRDALSQKYPNIKLPSSITDFHFDYEKNFPEEHQKRVKAVRLKKGFFLSLPMLRGAKEGLEQLKNMSLDVRIVTAPTWEWKHCVREKYEWVEKHLGREWCGRMILTRDKTYVRGDILIDDAPVITGAFKPTWEHVVFDHSYNREAKGALRVTWQNMQEVITVIKG
jgi:5'-nucleotidase